MHAPRYLILETIVNSTWKASTINGPPTTRIRPKRNEHEFSSGHPTAHATITASFCAIPAKQRAAHTDRGVSRLIAGKRDSFRLSERSKRCVHARICGQKFSGYARVFQKQSRFRRERNGATGDRGSAGTDTCGSANPSGVTRFFFLRRSGTIFGALTRARQTTSRVPAPESTTVTTNFGTVESVKTKWLLTNQVITVDRLTVTTGANLPDVHACRGA